MAGIMMSVTPAQVRELRRNLRAVTKSRLREVYGISEGTWARIRDGRPIRVSTFARMLVRYERHLAKPEGGDGRARRRDAAALRGIGAAA